MHVGWLEMSERGLPTRVRVVSGDHAVEVAIGQVWEDRDPRIGRELVIEGFTGAKAFTRTLGGGRRAEIRLDRFLPRERAYRLVADMPRR